MGSAAAVIRRATPDDVPVMYRIWREADGEPAVRPGAGAAVAAAAQVLPLHEHLVRAGTTLVAELDGVPVGFAAAVEEDGVVLLSDVFVVRQGEGIGRRLLDALFEIHPSPRRYTAASSDPRAVPLYRSFGMAARGDLLHLERPPAGRAWTTRSGTARGRTMGAPDDAFVAAMHRWLGRARSNDLSYWATLGAQAVLVGDPPVGGGLVCPTTPWVPEGDATRLGPIAAADVDDAAEVVLGVLAAALAMPDRAPAVRLVIGATHPAVAPLLDLGFEVIDRDTYLASDGDICDLRRHIGAADLW